MSYTYLQHDFNARKDPKFVVLRTKGHREAEGCYWAVIEYVHETCHGLDASDDSVDFFGICHDLCASEAEVHEWLSQLCDVGLLYEEYGIYSSHRAEEWIESKESISKKRQKAGRAGGLAKAKNGDSLANAKQNPSNCQNLPEQNPSNITKQNLTKLNKTKEKREPRKKLGEFGHVLLSDSDISKLDQDFPGTWRSYVTKVDEWVEQKGKPYKNYRIAIKNWIARDSQQGRASPAQTSRVYTVASDSEGGWI